MTNRLYYGDNLDVLRDHVADESIDLVYLDPPFNSNASYNVLWSTKGSASDASIEAFDDTWTWGDASKNALLDIASSTNIPLKKLMDAFHGALGDSPIMAYLAMMAVRLVELQRVLKDSGSLYLHCDPTASHYLKLVLDAVFGAENFRREIIWRSGWVSGFKTAAKNWVRNHDTIFYYLKNYRGDWTFNKEYKPHAADYARRGGGENPKGKAIDDVWDDPELYSPNIKSFSTEKLGYPTQKPRALLERIIKASSNAGDVVLDPFCGCGTAVDAAQKLGRKWIGVDVTHIAIGMIEDRMRSGYQGIEFETIGVPKDLAGALKLAEDDKHQFQQWACWQVGGYPRDKKGGDKGVDGWFNALTGKDRIETGVISVKGGENLNPAMVRDLGRVMERDKHRFGLFITAAEPTKGVREEIASHPMIETEFGRFPAMQVVTVEQFIHGPKPELPPLISPVKKAARVETRASHKPGAQGELI